jgi:hypothetical protein
MVLSSPTEHRSRPFPLPQTRGRDYSLQKRTELTWAPFAPPACRDLGRSALTWTSRQRLILFLAVDVSDISVLLIAILDEDRTVEVLIGEFVIIFPFG